MWNDWEVNEILRKKKIYFKEIYSKPKKQKQLLIKIEFVKYNWMIEYIYIYIFVLIFDTVTRLILYL